MGLIYNLNQILGIGLEPKDLGLLQVSLRTIIVFFVTLVSVRIADKRFLARMTAFDAIVAFILGSMLARGINGSAPFYPTLCAGFIIVLLHKGLAWFAERSKRFSQLVKGQGDLLIDHGRIIRKAMHRNHISEEDLLEELRMNGNVEDPSEVKRAVIERSGQVSVVTNSKQA